MAIITPRVTIQPNCNSIKFYPAIPTGLNVLGQASYSEQRLPWQYPVPYTQKATYTDILNILIHTQWATDTGDSTPDLYLCSNERDKDGLPVVISAIDLNVAPYQKGEQVIIGNNFVDPFTGAATNLISVMWAFSFGDFVADLAGDGYYWLKLENKVGGEDNLVYYSEPIYLAASHRNTSLYQFTYNANDGDKNIVVTEWFDDFPDSTMPYSPVFTVRAETYILPLDPKAVNVGYLQQSYQQVQVFTQQQQFRSLKVGEIALGIPDYLLEIITEALLSDTLFIDNYAYVLYNTNSNASLSDIWKSKRDDNVQLLKASTVIMEKYNSQSAMLSPVTPIFEGIFDGVYDATFA